MLTMRSIRFSTLGRLRRYTRLGIPARAATVSGVVVLVALALAGSGLGLILYRYLIAGVDDATATRTKSIIAALQAGPPDHLDRALLTTSQRIVAIQIIDGNDRVVTRSGSAPATALVPVTRFGAALTRGLSDDAVADDDMRVSGQRVETARGDYTVIVGGGSEAVEATTRTAALLFACGAPIVVLVASVASYQLVRRSLQSVEAIRSRVADISASDLAERVPEPAGRDEISALAGTLNQMLARIEAGHRAQQRFVSDASHELRSPLTTIISGLEAAQDHPELLNAELAQQTLLPEAHRMRILIDDLLLLARADEKSLVLRNDEVPLAEVADDEAARIRPESGCAITVTATPVRVIGDYAALARVVRNLVENAARHALSRIDVNVTSHDGQAILTVSDDGPGIAARDRTRVFERFVRLDTDRSRSSGGTGLGLAIVAEVVAAHRGTVAVGGGPGQGTTIVVALPQPISR